SSRRRHKLSKRYWSSDVCSSDIIEIDVKEMNIDLLSTSAHKVNGPKFLGFLYEKDGLKVSNLLLGGEQESKRRPGTENVPGIARSEERRVGNDKKSRLSRNLV